MVAAVTVALIALQQQPLDTAYTAAIRRYTSEPRFNTELTDHLPADPHVPTPLQVLGYVPGTPGRLSYVADITRYFRALDAASPRVAVFDLGRSDEGRPMILVAIADSTTIAHLDQYRAITAALADPRPLSPDSARILTATGKPMYYLTGSIHSPETGLAGNVDGAGVPAGGGGHAARPTDPGQRDHADHPGHGGGRAGPHGGRLPLPQSPPQRRPAARVLGEVHGARQQPRRDRHVAGADPDDDGNLPGVAPDGAARSARVGAVPLHVDRDRALQSRARRARHHRVARARLPGDHRADPRGLPGVWTHDFYDGWVPNYMFWSPTGTIPSDASTRRTRRAAPDCRHREAAARHRPR